MNSTHFQSREAIVAFAARLYGANWQDSLAAEAGVTRADLTRALAGDGDLDASIMKAIDALAEHYGVMPRAVTREELIDFARTLYGDAWRDEMPKALAMDRRTLVKALASPKPLCEDLILKILRLADQHLQNEMAAFEARLHRVSWLKSTLTGETSRTFGRTWQADAA